MNFKRIVKDEETVFQLQSVYLGKIQEGFLQFLIGNSILFKNRWLIFVRRQQFLFGKPD